MSLAIYSLPANSTKYHFWIESDEFAVVDFHVQEAMNDIGGMTINGVSHNASLDLHGMLGKRAKLQITMGTEDDPKKRYYHGIVQRFSITGTDESAAYYEADIVPEIWFLTQKVRSRVHITDRAQNKQLKDVINQVMKESSLDSFTDLSLNRSYQPFTFLTQYQESDFDFLMRLMEEEGISMYIDHRDDHEYFVFTDKTSSNPHAAPFDEVLVRRSSGALMDEYEAVEKFRVRHQVGIGKVEFRNYDFKDSKRRLVDTATASQGNSKLEYYEFGGGFQDQEGAKDRMKRLSENRADEFNSAVVEATGEGDYRSLSAGKIFKAKGAASEALNREWLCTRVEYEGVDEGHADSETAPMGGGGAGYRMKFTCVPGDISYRPPRKTKRPLAVGTQTAIVVGPSGQEIHTDKFGRVKVHMHWDRLPKQDAGSVGTPNYDDKSSFWCRVAQTAAGKGWGIFSLPRVGQEVVIDFVGGNTDQPIVVGVMHNDHQTPPYALPDHQTRTTIKTNSSPGGNGFNELRFEDKAGSEQIFMHAEKNLDIRVKAESMEAVGGNKHLIVGSEKYPTDQRELVYGNVDLEVKKTQQEYIHEDHIVKIDGNQYAIVGAERAVVIKGDSTEQIDGTVNQIYSGEIQLDGGSSRTTTIGADDKASVTGKSSLMANEIVLSATTKLTLAVGPSFIVLDASGISIVGPMVKLNSGGMPGMPAMVQPLWMWNAPAEAKPEAPTPADNDRTGEKSMLPSPPQ